MYKPKEEVAVKGYIRKITGGKLGDVEASVSGAGTHVRRSARTRATTRSRRAQITTESVRRVRSQVHASRQRKSRLRHDRFHDAERIVQASAITHQFQIQEFRRPEFEVTAKVETEAPHFVGGTAMLSRRGEILRRRRSCQRRDELDRHGDARRITRRRTATIIPSARGCRGGGLRLRRIYGGRATMAAARRRRSRA